MLNWNKENPEFILANYGKLQLHKNKTEFEWSGLIKMPISKALIELTIEVEDQNVPSNKQIKQIQEFEKRWKSINDKLFQYMEECYRDSKWEKTKSELQTMYFLSAINLKKENFEWWIVLEPEFDVTTNFNFFPRFTLKNDEIIWCNLN
ncbi:hypothetical protein LX97_03113 [Nonlabens dokdonensis]|uniref:DUF2262 domain-containing protein n=2 Tax=Nonlabens dokdonensis TaxID=328515 RepID=L7WGG1_NONDD|nr:hypothetical protein [Nonlabens dokdonensis]AGC78023.1 hypothetical protein DDD_2896 [Nonlabens dokdonensis DSW-6]PZX37091.1 hypothetical protein LX97_03113 [Nonlabens dokdonensis]